MEDRKELEDREEILFDSEEFDEGSELENITPDKRKLYTEQGDPEIESLKGKFDRGRLIVQPDFQRQFVWDAGKASRLIESALLEIPLPVIYISEEEDGRECVIDGQQRLTSFFSFVNGKFPDGKDFKLTGLKVLKENEKKTFRELDEQLQDKIRYYKVRAIIFKKESNPDIKFEVFERLNTGSVSLNDQELRNCIYRGSYNNFTKELAKDEDFMYLLGLDKPDKRMRDVELVLRFLAFYNQTYLNYKPPIRNFLNLEAQKKEISEVEKQELRRAFKNACQNIRSLLDKNAFRRFYKGTEKDPNGYWEPKQFNASLYDILMYSMAKEDKNQIYGNLDSIREALIDLMTNDNQFIDSIQISTSGLPAVTYRFDTWRNTLQKIVGVGVKEPRCFTHKLKEELFGADSVCAICGHKILKIDDSAVDHIEQYWAGGKTIPENARLTHRFCNWSRARKE